MHFQNILYYYFIDQLDINLLNKLKKDINIIYRNYNQEYNEIKIKAFYQYCKKQNFKFYLSNNIKLSMKLGLDGAYIPSFNKSLKHNAFSFNQKFTLIGSAHNLKEIKIKENQNVKKIFISSLFPKKNKNILGIYKFKNLMKLTKKKIICLGGINKKNFRKIKFLNINGIAGINYFQDLK